MLDFTKIHHMVAKSMHCIEECEKPSDNRSIASALLSKVMLTPNSNNLTDKEETAARLKSPLHQFIMSAFD